MSNAANIASPGKVGVAPVVTHPDVKAITLKLLEYCRRNDWAGYDPYDALNSPLFEAIPLLDSRVIKIACTQALKRCPVNLRPLLRIPKMQNPKAMGLFLSALIRLKPAGCLPEDCLPSEIFERLKQMRSPNSDHWCWGYSFPWQTRTICVPRFAPNLVCTCFVATALFEYHEHCGDQEALEIALDAAVYIAGLYWEEAETNSFSYPRAGYPSRVHNANLLAAALLCRAARHQGEQLSAIALKAARYAVSRQNPDGSWFYGESPKQRWIDNFHTGFNLCALDDIARFAPTEEFSDSLARGYDFYVKHFFLKDGAPRYFSNQIGPIDVHSVAQSLITLTKLQRLSGASLPLALAVKNWAMRFLWDEEGYFCYQKRWWGKTAIPYMRWGQAWMLLALAEFERPSD